MKASHKTALVLSFSFVLSGIADQVYFANTGEPDITLALHSIIIAFGLFIWCKQHGKEHTVGKLGFYPVGIALLSIIVLPIYAFKNFGLKRGGLLLAKGIVAAIFSFAMYFLVIEVTRLIYA